LAEAKVAPKNMLRIKLYIESQIIVYMRELYIYRLVI
jgi:hypothetical protein